MALDQVRAAAAALQAGTTGRSTPTFSFRTRPTPTRPSCGAPASVWHRGPAGLALANRPLTFPLPQIAVAVSVPVLAARGIGDGRE